MASKNTAVFGIYKSVAQAERAVETLTTAGYANNDISVLLADAQESSRPTGRTSSRLGG